MIESKKRKVHTPELKAMVALEALRGQKSIREIAQEFGVHPFQVGQYKKRLLDQAISLFHRKKHTSKQVNNCATESTDG